MFLGLLWQITRQNYLQSPTSFSSLWLQSVSYRAQVSSAEKLRLSALGENTRKNKVEELYTSHIYYVPKSLQELSLHTMKIMFIDNLTSYAC